MLHSGGFEPRWIAANWGKATLVEVNSVHPLDAVQPPGDVQVFANRLFRGGAICSLATEPERKILVGDLRWTDDHLVFLFAAYGEGLRDAWRLCFDSVERASETTVVFRSGAQELARLTRIADAGVEDPDDYQVAWQLWQQVAPLRVELIDRTYRTLAGVQ